MRDNADIYKGICFRNTIRSCVGCVPWTMTVANEIVNNPQSHQYFCWNLCLLCGAIIMFLGARVFYSKCHNRT